MEEHPSASWHEFLNELRTEILPLYSEHERTFDYHSIHGRMHICRCLLFAEFMCRHYYEYTRLTPRVAWIRYAVAFHDSGRQGNGFDIWENDSAERCVQYLLGRDVPRDVAGTIGGLIPKDGGRWELEKRVVHDADVLDIMRPCCGHGGRMGFREQALRFLGRRDDAHARDPGTRSTLVEDAWILIEATEQIKPKLQPSGDYMGDVLEALDDLRDKFRLFADFLPK